MNRVTTLLFGTLMSIISLLTGGIFYANLKLSWKYRILVLVLPEKYQKKVPECSVPNLFGGLVIVNKITVDSDLVKFIILHEKGHCRHWRAIPPIEIALKSVFTGRLQGHEAETADFEYAADLYAAKNGAVEEAVVAMEMTYDYFRSNKEEYDRWAKKGINIKDSLNRARLLRKWKRANGR